jgi:transposase
VLSVEDWAEIRRLRRSERLPISEVARVLGISRNTVKSALASDGPPKYQRTPAGSVADEAEPRIRELLAAYPRMPATVIAERIDWSYSIRTLSERVRELRPVYLPPDPASRTTYVAGEIAQCDFWFPDVVVPVGYGQVRTATALPVLTMVCGYSRWASAVLIPTRAAEDLYAGWWQHLWMLGAVPRVLVWDGEGAIGRWRARQPELTAACQAFRGTLAAKVLICKPGDPEAKGLVERFHDYLERASSRAGYSAHRRTSTPNWPMGWCGPITASTGCWGAARRIGSKPTKQRCWRCHQSGPVSGGAIRPGCRAITTCAATATTTRCSQSRSDGASR